MARRWIPRVCGGIFVAGIAGLIISSVAGNNAGFVLSIGLGIAFERTKRIGVPILMHVLFNAGNVAITLMMK